MFAGELQARITIQQKSVTQNSLGEEVITWPALATVWAKVTAVSGSEAMAQGLAMATTIYQVTIRARAGVTSAMRVLYNGMTLEILAVLQSSDTVYKMQLDCKQVV